MSIEQESKNMGPWMGFQFTRGQNNSLSYSTAKYGNIKLANGELVNNISDCEYIEPKNGTLECPDGKFIAGYDQVNNKFMCCKISTSDQIYANPVNCESFYHPKEVTDLKCPDNKFLRRFVITPNTSMIECCAINVDRSPVTKEIMGLCKTYGVNNCTKDSLKNTTDMCQKFGMRYYDVDEMRYKNTDSYMNCHVDNFDKLQDNCKKKGLQECSFYNLKNKDDHDLENVKESIISIDQIEGRLEKSFLVEYKVAILAFGSIILLLMVILIIYIIMKN